MFVSCYTFWLLGFRSFCSEILICCELDIAETLAQIMTGDTFLLHALPGSELDLSRDTTTKIKFARMHLPQKLQMR